MDFGIIAPELDWLKSAAKRPLNRSDVDITIISKLQPPSIIAKVDNKLSALKEIGDDSSDEDDENVYFASTLSGDKTPKFLSDAIKLIKSGEPDLISTGLESLESLIVNSSDMDVSENCMDICKALIHLQDEFSIPNFNQMWNNSIVNLCFRETEMSSEALVGSIFTKDVSLVSKQRSIRVLLAVPMIVQVCTRIDAFNFSRNNQRTTRCWFSTDLQMSAKLQVIMPNYFHH